MKFSKAPSLRYLLLSFLFVLLMLPVDAQDFQWVRSPGGADMDRIYDMVTDEAGNSYITGSFGGFATFGSQSFTSTGFWNAYIARYDAGGNLDWIRIVESDSNGTSTGSRLALGPGGKLYVGGASSRTAYIGNDTLEPLGFNSNWVALFDTSGNHSWTRMIQSLNSAEYIRGMTADPNGDLIVAGIHFEVLYFPGDSLPDHPGTNSYLAKFDQNGNLEWTLQGGSKNGGMNFSDVETDGLGNIYLTGISGDSAYLGAVVDTGQGNVMARVNPNGSVAWFDIQDNASPYYWQQIETDLAGNTYQLGYYLFNVHVGTTTLTSLGARDLFLAKYDSGGNVIWVQNLPGGSDEYTQSLHLIGDSLLGLSGYFRDSLSLGSIVLPPTQGSNNIFVAQCDTAGSFRWATTIVGGSGGYLGMHGMGSDAQGNLYISGEFSNVFTPGNIVVQSKGNIDVYLAKLLDQSNEIRAHVFQDWNNNQTQDMNDADMPGILIGLQPGNNQYMTGLNGMISAYTDTGSYTLSIPNPPKYYTVTPASHSASFSAYNQVDSNNVFAMYPTPNVQDLRILLTTRTPVRPGRPAIFHADYANVGTIDMSGYVMVVPNQKLTFNRSVPMPDTIQGDTLIWNFSNLKVWDFDQISMVLDGDTSLQVGTSIQVEAFIRPETGDTFPGDNYSAVEPVVVASYDPNDKQVTPKQFTPVQVSNGDWLSYVIRFQNTGNDTAWVIKVRDTLSSLLDWSTFEMEAASHPYALSIRGGNRLEWVFNDIRLPDSMTNWLESQGFVRFRVKSKPGLNIGDEIKNKASIYFDYNVPVITNIATTSTDTLVAVDPGMPDLRLELLLYPNPASDRVTLDGVLPVSGQVDLSLIALDGKVVRQWNWQQEAGSMTQTLDVGGLAAGVYTLHFKSGQLTGYKKIVIQQ